MIHFVRRSGVALFSLVLFALCGALATIMNSGDRWHVFAGDIQVTTTELAKRVNKLWMLAEWSGSRDFRTMVLIQGNYCAKLNTEEEMERWQQHIGETIELERKYEQGKEVYRGSYVTHSVKADILWFQEDMDRVYYTISIQGLAKGGMMQATAEGERMMIRLLQRYGAKWTATVQAVSNDSLQASFVKAEQALKKQGQVESLDRYEDERTISVTYQTDYLGQGVQMGQSNANVQLAVHENRDKGETRISFGTPLIAGEY